jgi:uncharacterized protein YegL
MSSQQTSENAKAAIQNAMSQGLAGQAGQIMISNLDDTTLMGCVGASIDDLDATEATLVATVLDASGSMHYFAKSVIDEHNNAVEAVKKSKGSATILWSQWQFSDKAVPAHGYMKVEDLQPMTSKDYRPTGGTALYDATISCLTALTIYGQQLTDNGVPNRRILFILSDGDDNVSNSSIVDVKTAIESCRRKENYIFAFAGFGDSGPELEKLALQMGIPADCVTNGKDASSLRRIFQQMSQSVSRVSQGSASTGGFF